MFRNHFKIALRNIIRHKSHALINICGLAVGITVCLIIFIVIRFELSFDNYHQKKDRTYRVLTEYHHPNVPVFTNKAVPYVMSETLKTSFPQIEKTAPVYQEDNTQIMVLDDNGSTIKRFKEEKGVFFTEPSLFDIFDFEWLTGTAGSLKAHNTVVLSKETAIKYFGSWENAMGKNLKWNNAEDLKVTGVLASIPKNTDLQIKMVISYGTGYTSQFIASDDWDSTNGSFGTFVLLSQNASEASLNTQLRALAKEKKTDGNEDSHLLQPLNEIHFDTKAGNFSGKSISSQLINVLWMVAAFILLIACVNFINLSTVQTVNRFREIGVRKVLGSSHIQLKTQFLTETFLIVIVAVIFSFCIVSTSLKYVGVLFDIPLAYDLVYTAEIFLFFILISISVTFLAGFYPSIVLSKFSPVDALKSKITTTGNKGVSLRRGLVVFQFAIAQILIIGTIIIVQQMDYFMNQPLGFEKDAIVSIAIPRDSVSLRKVDYLRNRLASVNGIQNVSFNSGTPISDDNWWTTFVFDNNPESIDFFIIAKGADHKYLSTYEMPLVAGRNVRELNTAQEFLVNETLIKKLGFSTPEEALNKEINLGEGDVVGPIVGVLKDFHARSFKRDLDPVMMTSQAGWYDRAGIKLESKKALTTLKTIENIWNETFPDYIFEYNFLDEQVASYYEQEQRLSAMYKLSAALAIFLSCLGLYGLASFLVMQRTKEAGIRKVLGATKRSIIYLFSKEFIVLVSIAFCIAAPISGYFMQQWLQDYPYRINITWTVFIMGGGATMAIALATVSYQALKAATSNPIKSLRTE